MAVTKWHAHGMAAPTEVQLLNYQMSPLFLQHTAASEWRELKNTAKKKKKRLVSEEKERRGRGLLTTFTPFTRQS